MELQNKKPLKMARFYIENICLYFKTDTIFKGGFFFDAS